MPTTTGAAGLKERIQEDMKAAMRAREQQRLDAIRLILAAIKQREVDERLIADDAVVLGVLDKMLKQRRDSFAQFQAANRQDLADQENFEIQVIQSYMPVPLTDAEIDALITAAIAATGATAVKDMGKVMAEVRTKVQGRADVAQVSAKVKERLAG